MYKYNILKPRDVTCKYRSFKRLNMPITILPFTTAIVKTYGLYNNSIILQ